MNNLSDRFKCIYPMMERVVNIRIEEYSIKERRHKGGQNLIENFNIFCSKNEYSQPEKNKVRKEALSNAVDILTVNRDSSTITTLNYFDKVEHLCLMIRTILMILRLQKV